MVPTELNSVASTTVKKKARPNPARRKASRAKLEEKQSRQHFAGASKLGFNATEEAIEAPTGAKKGKQFSSDSSPQSKETHAKFISDVAANGKLAGKHSTPQHSNAKTLPTLAVAAPAMVTGGLVGCVAGAAVLCGSSLWKNMAGTESAILTARAAKLSIDNLIEELITSLRAGTYSGVEALDMLRRTTLAYASAIPGGSSFVERVFCEIETVRKQRGAEVDVILRKASCEIAKVSQGGVPASQLQIVVLKQLANLASFAKNASLDVLARNPELRQYCNEATNAVPKPPQRRVSTVKVNMAIRHKPTAIASRVCKSSESSSLSCMTSDTATARCSNGHWHS